MKKLFLSMLAVVSFTGFAMAQCTPDPSLTVPGIYPDTTVNLPQGYVGVFYDTDIQLRVITDTTVLGFNVVVNEIVVDSVSGLPGTYAYECSPANCTFAGGSNGCIRLSGTSGIGGNYDLDVHVTLYGTIFGFIPVTQSAVIEGYRIELIPPPPAPVAVFNASQNVVCENDVVTFTDMSSNGPDSWSWSFPGGTPSTSSDPNPVVEYDTPGVYDVTLTVSNPGGSDNITVTDYITVNEKPLAKITPTGTVSFCYGNSELLSANIGPGFTYQWYKYGNLLVGETGQTLSINSAGKYKVKVTDPSTGCTKRSGLRTVTVQTPPAVAIASTGSTTFCRDLSVDLVATTDVGNSVQWTKGGVDIPGATSNTYTVTKQGFYKARAITSIGCEKSSQGITVTVLPAPNAGVTASGPLSFCQGDDVTLSALSVPGNSYQWELDLVPINGAINSDYTADVAGKYTVFIEAANGCFRRSGVKKVIITCRQGLTDQQIGNHVSVMPNPTSGLAQLELQIAKTAPVSIDVFDITGKQQLSVINSEMEAGAYSIQLDLESYPRGLYFVRVINGNEVTTTRLVVQ